MGDRARLTGSALRVRVATRVFLLLTLYRQGPEGVFFGDGTGRVYAAGFFVTLLGTTIKA